MIFTISLNVQLDKVACAPEIKPGKPGAKAIAMKATILKAFGTPLSIESWPDPVLGTGEVIVDVVVAAPVLSYTNEVFSGERKYLLELPLVPGLGAVGRVRSFGPDATHLQVGNWVFCDPTVRSRDDALTPPSPCKAGARAAREVCACNGIFKTALSPSR